MQFFPPLTGHRDRHFTTLVALICGVAGGQRAHLSTIADHAPTGSANQESVIARFRRWLKHDAHTLDGWFLPVAKALLENLSHQPLLLAIDGSVVGRGCIALMVSVIYHGRALPLCWVVAKGKKGHFPQEMHCALLDQLHPLVPQLAEVILLGAMASLMGPACRRCCAASAAARTARPAGYGSCTGAVAAACSDSPATACSLRLERPVRPSRYACRTGDGRAIPVA